MKESDRSSEVELDRLRKEKWMKVNDRSEEAEIDHWSETEKYWSKPTIDLSNVKSMV